MRHNEASDKRTALKPLSDFMFLACTRFKEHRPVKDFVKALDESGYWGNRQFTPEEKTAHVLHKIETIRMPKGLMARYRLDQRLSRFNRHYGEARKGDERDAA